LVWPCPGNSTPSSESLVVLVLGVGVGASEDDVERTTGEAVDAVDTAREDVAAV
jgi:hypothetical protein